MYNKGKYHRRLKENPEERRFAKAWEKVNTEPKEFGLRHHMLRHMLSVRGERCPTPAEIELAATIIQWLGSPVGRGFLADLGYKKDETKPKPRK